MQHNRIKVLVVEDSNVVRQRLLHILNSDPQIEVVGTANNGAEALKFLDTEFGDKSPDIILMDVQMPHMDGFEATRRIMETRPVPIIICSGSSQPREAIAAGRVTDVGAVAFIDKPRGHGHANYEAAAAGLLQTVKLMSEVKVVRRWPRGGSGSASPSPSFVSRSSSAISSPASSSRRAAKIEIVGIGASTGGPPVLEAILKGLPSDFSVPILVVQHISPGFLENLIEWLNRTTDFTVQIATHNLHPLSRHVYFAPDNAHMAYRAGRIVISHEPPEESLRPSISHLFRSLADSCGASAVGILLTGMGRDGAAELKRMKDRGATTIVQDAATSVVHGMPGEAIALGAASFVLPIERIAGALTALVNEQKAH